MLVGCLKEQGGIILTEAITRQTGSNPFVPFNIKPVSNPYPYSEEEKSRKGAPSAQQDKGLVQSASVPPSECLGQWETHVTEKKGKRSLTRAQRDELRCVSWALKDTILSKLVNDESFRYRVQSRVFMERHWNLLSKDWQKRNALVPEILHDGYGYVRNMAETVADYCGIRLSRETEEKIMRGLFWLFLVGGHAYVKDSFASEA